MTRLRIRPACPDDIGFLREMLYQALYVPAGTPPFPRAVLDLPDIARYVVGFGRAGDVGRIAETDRGEPIGAAWTRLFTADDRGYGWVDHAIPELTIAILHLHRGRGVGSDLLHNLCAALSGRYPAVSLSVSPQNPARRLYERCGFECVTSSAAAITMVKSLDAGEPGASPPRSP